MLDFLFSHESALGALTGIPGTVAVVNNRMGQTTLSLVLLCVNKYAICQYSIYEESHGTSNEPIKLCVELIWIPS